METITRNIKITVVGERLSGKSSLIKRFFNNTFDESLKNEVKLFFILLLLNWL